MRGRTLALLLVGPLILIATEVAHALAYRLAYEHPHDRTAALAATGHGYSTYWPDAFGAVLALLLATLAFRAVSAARGSLGALRIRLWWFVLLPGLVFAAQEHVERLAAGGAIP